MANLNEAKHAEPDMRYDCWMILISTHSDHPIFGEALEVMWQHITKNSNRFVMISPEEKNPEQARILRVRQSHSVEIGPNHGHYHLHGKLEIKTQGMHRLNYQVIKQFIDFQLEPYGDVSFLNCKLVPNYNANKLIANYIGKDPVNVPITGQFQLRQ